ncbi:MAG: hypothetical protein GY781_00470 [Gammaproteobacteria bacterium]|nr:hypothetical protein [Gammaproteobacteria bacterium]
MNMLLSIGEYNQAIKYAPVGRRTAIPLREISAVYCGRYTPKETLTHENK